MYGGTKTEMERLLADAQKLTGVKYDINNLSDVYEAIHVIQENLGITGTTAKEAEETLTGSFMAMKASAENVLGNMALGENLKPSLIDLADTAATFLFGNFIPMLTEIVKNIPTMIATLIEAGAPHILNAGKTLINNLGLGIEESLSSMDFSGIKTFFESLFSALSNAFDILMSYVAPAIERLVESFVNLWNAAQPIISLLSELLMPVFEIVATFIGEVFTVAVDILTTAFDMLAVALELLTPVFEFLIDLFNLISPALSTVADWVIWVAEKFGILSFSSEDLKTVTEVVWPAIKNAIETAKTSINNAIEKIKNTYESLKEKGTNLKESISQVWQSIQNKINSVKGAIGRAIERIKNIFNDLVSSGNRLKDSLSQAWSKIQSAVETAKGKIEGSINRIKGLFESLGNINLFSAGKAILDGFLRGLKSAWGRVKNFVGGIAGWIKDHKGPISYDRRLLIPAGRAIMGSLDKGLTKYFSDVKSTVSSMGQQIADEMTSSFGNMDGQLAYADAQFNHTLRSEVVSPQDKLGEVLNAMLPKFSPEVVVTLDGREIARASRDYTDEELENKRYQENFGTGGRF